MIRPASTVILVREENKELEVYLLRRSSQAGFMGGLHVFPGGVVDKEDWGSETWAPYIDMSLDQIGKQLGGTAFSTEDALAFSIAAIRETLEEAGVFLASGKDKADVEDICTFRLNKDLPKAWFRTRIKEGKFKLSLSCLGRWSHWLTPKLMKKRFDTRFFIVFMPEHQICVPDNMETGHGTWISPQNALEQNLEGRIPLSPPAIVTLSQLLKFNDRDELKLEIQSRSWGDPIEPRMVQTSNGPVIIEPWDDMFDIDAEIDTSDLSGKVLLPGSWFSRLWCDNGVWKPIGI